MRVNVRAEGADQVLWYKVGDRTLEGYLRLKSAPVQERFLSDDEIVEHIVVR